MFALTFYTKQQPPYCYFANLGYVLGSLSSAVASLLVPKAAVQKGFNIETYFDSCNRKIIISGGAMVLLNRLTSLSSRVFLSELDVSRRVSVSSRSHYANVSSLSRTLKVSENGHVSIET